MCCQNVKVAMTGRLEFCCYFLSIYCLLRYMYVGFVWGHVWVISEVCIKVKMTTAQVVETSVTNNSLSQHSPHPDDHTKHVMLNFIGKHGLKLQSSQLPVQLKLQFWQPECVTWSQSNAEITTVFLSNCRVRMWSFDFELTCNLAYLTCRNWIP